MRLGQFIKAYREQNRISLRKLAKEIGVAYWTLYDFERGDEIGAKPLARIVVFLFDKP